MKPELQNLVCLLEAYSGTNTCMEKLVDHGQTDEEVVANCVKPLDVLNALDREVQKLKTMSAKRYTFGKGIAGRPKELGGAPWLCERTAMRWRNGVSTFHNTCKVWNRPTWPLRTARS